MLLTGVFLIWFNGEKPREKNTEKIITVFRRNEGKMTPNVKMCFIARDGERCDTALSLCGDEVEHKAANLQTKRRPRSRSSRRLEIAPRRLYTCSSRRHCTEYKRARTRIMLDYEYSIYYGDTELRKMSWSIGDLWIVLYKRNASYQQNSDVTWAIHKSNWSTSWNKKQRKLKNLRKS